MKRQPSSYTDDFEYDIDHYDDLEKYIDSNRRSSDYNEGYSDYDRCSSSDCDDGHYVEGYSDYDSRDDHGKSYDYYGSCDSRDHGGRHSSYNNNNRGRNDYSRNSGSRDRSYDNYDNRGRNYDSYDSHGRNRNDYSRDYDDNQGRSRGKRASSYDRYPAGNSRRKISSASKIVSLTIIIVAACVMLFCVYKLISINSEYKEAENAYKLVDDQFTEETDDSEEASWVWDFDKLKDMCSDAVGYIVQKGIMSYPIVQGVDNDQYLRSLMNGEYSIAGTIFVDANFPAALDGQYAIVYGHNMNDNSMFGTLSEYQNESYYKEHPYFDIYIGYKHYKYYVFSAFTTPVDSYVYSYNFSGSEEFTAFINTLRSECPYNTDAKNLTADDHVITLSTCVDFHDYDYRYVVCLVRGEEITD